MTTGKIFRAIVSGTILLLVLAADALALSAREKLVYDLTWAGIKAGTATLEITYTGGSPRIVSTARSADWVSVFYTVDDRIETVLAGSGPGAAKFLPVSYRVRIREGRRRRDRGVIFDRGRGSALFSDYLDGEKKNLPIKGSIYDPLSSFYYLRTLRMEVGKSVFVDILDNKKVRNVEVRVIRKEKVTTKLGTFHTIVIKPLFRSEDIFTRRGDLYIWLTDDPKRIPVKIQTQAGVGSITATLVAGWY